MLSVCQQNLLRVRVQTFRVRALVYGYAAVIEHNATCARVLGIAGFFAARAAPKLQPVILVLASRVHVESYGYPLVCVFFLALVRSRVYFKAVSRFGIIFIIYVAGSGNGNVKAGDELIFVCHPVFHIVILGLAAFTGHEFVYLVVGSAGNEVVGSVVSAVGVRVVVGARLKVAETYPVAVRVEEVAVLEFYIVILCKVVNVGVQLAVRVLVEAVRPKRIRYICLFLRSSGVVVRLAFKHVTVVVIPERVAGQIVIHYRIVRRVGIDQIHIRHRACAHLYLDAYRRIAVRTERGGFADKAVVVNLRIVVVGSIGVDYNQGLDGRLAEDRVPDFAFIGVCGIYTVYVRKRLKPIAVVLDIVRYIFLAQKSGITVGIGLVVIVCIRTGRSNAYALSVNARIRSGGGEVVLYLVLFALLAVEVKGGGEAFFLESEGRRVCCAGAVFVNVLAHLHNRKVGKRQPAVLI